MRRHVAEARIGASLDQYDDTGFSAAGISTRISSEK
jgi:hypothetical protein